MFETGPYVAVAVLCERVLQEKDGVISLIRIVDRIVSTATGPNVPDPMPPVPINLTSVITLRSGQARGRHSLVIRPEEPSGQQLAATEIPVFLEGEDRGANVVIQLAIVANQEGLYWFDVILNDRLLTRMPLRVIYQPQRTG